MLDKRLTLGGLQVGGPRTIQNPARFRVANNVYQTIDDYMVPRFDNVASGGAYAGAESIKSLARYKGKVFALGYKSGRYVAYYEGVEIPSPNLPSVFGAHGPQFVEKQDCLYVNFPASGLYKFDGFQMYRAGTPLPCVNLTSNATGSLISPWVTIVQHHLDWQGNIVNSGFIRRQYSNIRNNTLVEVDKSASVAAFGIPGTEDFASIDKGFNAFYAKISSSSFFGPEIGDIVVTTGGDHNVKVGGRLLSANLNGLSASIKALSYKVKSIAATEIIVVEPKYLSEGGEWLPFATAFFPTGILSNYWASVWTSSVETGNYALQGIVPTAYDSNVSLTVPLTLNVAMDTPTTIGRINTFNLSGNLGDIYDVTSVKTIFPLSAKRKNMSFTTFAGMALISYENEIFHSDTSKGGNFEMTAGFAFIVVGEGDDGAIQSICGTGDFMLISRQYKNYYLTGYIPTANYKVAEIPQTNMGAYSNEASISVNDKIIFMNKQGIWAVYGGGRCEDVSQFIKGLFDNFSNTHGFSEETYFDLDSYPTYAGATANQWLRPRLDINRNLLAFVVHGGGYGQALVLNLSNGEFYTWSELTSASDFQDMTFIDGKYYVTSNDPLSIKVNVEDKTNPVPSELQTTWFTTGEPSLEKKLNQLKIWGLIDCNVGVSHCLDWKDAVILDGQYANPASLALSHKHRLHPANFQAVSIGMDFDGEFQIEGLEIEFQILQMGMKR
jgi:hypothetical protein